MSLDNVFVFVVLFQAFRVPPEFQHRVLFWGVLGALLLRGTFIFAGAALLRQFDWLMLVLAAVLILSGARLLWTGGVSREDPKNSRIYRFVARRMHVTQDFEGKDFIVFRSGRWHATPLLLTLIVVETTDVMFAFDSIPAVFSVTKDSLVSSSRA